MSFSLTIFDIELKGEEQTAVAQYDVLSLWVIPPRDDFSASIWRRKVPGLEDRTLHTEYYLNIV